MHCGWICDCVCTKERALIQCKSNITKRRKNTAKGKQKPYQLLTQRCLLLRPRFFSFAVWLCAVWSLFTLPETAIWNTASTILAKKEPLIRTCLQKSSSARRNHLKSIQKMAKFVVLATAGKFLLIPEMTFCGFAVILAAPCDTTWFPDGSRRSEGPPNWVT